MKRRTAISLNALKVLAILGVVYFSVTTLYELNSVKDLVGDIRREVKFRGESWSATFRKCELAEKKLGDMEVRFVLCCSSLFVLALLPWARMKES